MFRKVCRLVFLLIFVFIRFSTAQENRQQQGESEQSLPKAGQRLDREKMKQLRAKLAAEKFNDSTLKKMNWKIGDTEREALVYVPDSPVRNMPLVFVFHGHGGRPEHPARRLAIHKKWPEAVCIYPLGLPTPIPILDPQGKFSGWQKLIGDQQDRDLLFFDAMLKTISTDHSIDVNRVYGTGHSNGGYFTYVLWAARGDKLAAVAPIASTHDQFDSKLMKPKPVLHIAGEQDPIVRFHRQQQTMEFVRTLNDCQSDGKKTGMCTEYDSALGTDVVTFIHPGGHEIPDDAGQRIVDFFHSYPKK